MPQAALPIIDISPLLQRADAVLRQQVAAQIGDACRTQGFFYITGHGIAAELQAGLQAASEAFFALPQADKMRIEMQHGGRAWRGYFPVGGELTSGQPDLKEGLYLGTELSPEDPRVRAGWPLHGANLWPERPQELRALVVDYMQATERAAHAVLEGVALSLGLEEGGITPPTRPSCSASSTTRRNRRGRRNGALANIPTMAC